MILNLIQNVILNLIQDRLKMILAFVKMTTTDDFTVILNLIQDLLKNDSDFRQNDNYG